MGLFFGNHKSSGVGDLIFLGDSGSDDSGLFSGGFDFDSLNFGFCERRSKPLMILS